MSQNTQKHKHTVCGSGLLGKSRSSVWLQQHATAGNSDFVFALQMNLLGVLKVCDLHLINETN